jgi:hypothetical protein
MDKEIKKQADGVEEIRLERRCAALGTNSIKCGL